LNRLTHAQGHAREAKFDRVRRILDYEIPAVRMIDHSFDEGVDAFTRINTPPQLSRLPPKT
jgi:hypothetical protein